MGTSLNYLAWITLKEDQVKTAKYYLDGALNIAIETQSKSLILDCIATGAMLAHYKEKYNDARQLQTLVLEHPISAPEAQDFLREMQIQFDSQTETENTHTIVGNNLEKIAQNIQEELEN